VPDEFLILCFTESDLAPFLCTKTNQTAHKLALPVLRLVLQETEPISHNSNSVNVTV